MTVNRREFLTLSAATLAGGMLTACNSELKSAAPLLKLATTTNEGIERWMFRHRAEDRVPGGAKVSGKDFPHYFISESVPVWDPATRGAWRLEVSGAVQRPLSLSLEDLQRLPRITQKVDHFCVEGWNARVEWAGVRFSEIAKAAGLLPDAHYVDFQSFDNGYHESWDLESTMHPQTMIAYAKDGGMLGAAHGAPARLHSPVKLGYKNTKYLTKIVFMPKQNGGYWSDDGYEWYGGT
jgi:DMSO/TMAO reductase YedYZ molybdopterin-dependent catalytic subunit